MSLYLPDEWLDTVARRAASTRVTLEATAAVAFSAIEQQIPGDFAEAGVFLGANAAVLARIVETFDGKRRVHLFDSFQGVPAPSPPDREWIAAGHPVGVACASRISVENNMREWGLAPETFVWHEGWFHETLPGFAGPLAVLRIDCDLYASHRLVMRHLYPQVSPGGWIIADDYALSGARRAIHQTVIPGPVYWRKEW